MNLASVMLKGASQCSFILTFYLYENVLSACTELQRFDFLTKNFTTVGPPLDTVVVGLLGCVQFCKQSRCCSAFKYHLGNETCSTFFHYSNLTSGHDGAETIYSLIRDWKEFGVSNDQFVGPFRYNDKKTKGYTCIVRHKNKEMSYYKGTMNVTTKGYSCQRWDSQTPNKHRTGRESKNFVNSGECIARAANYCRIPLGYRTKHPWCFVNNPNERFDWCDVEYCE